MKSYLAKNRRGRVRIWEEPDPAEDYFIGIDSSEGMRGGDYAAACVVAGEDCRQVAEVHGLVEPGEWGRMMCRLGAHYNEALLGFETHPSAHGLVAARAAVEYGYNRIYTRIPKVKAAGDPTDKLGWYNDSKGKALVINAISVAINEVSVIRSKALLDELMTRKYNDRGDIVGEGHDDLMVAYGLALVVRHDAYRRGMAQTPVVVKKWDPDMDPNANHWDESTDDGQEAELWDGC